MTQTIKEKANQKYAIVTGGSSGVGRQYALQLAAKGYNILLVSNDAKGNEKVTAEIKSLYPVIVLPFLLDLTQASSIDALTQVIDEQSFDIEVLICNAGILVFGGVTSTPSHSIERAIALHCLIPTLLCREFAKRISMKKRGYILIMSSSTAWMPYPTIATYSATKAYLKSFAQALYYELRDQGVKVTAVFPGAVDTPFYTLDDKIRHRLLWWNIMLTPEKVARYGLRALFKGHRRCITGVFNKCSVAICAILPSFALLPVLRIKRLRKLW